MTDSAGRLMERFRLQFIAGIALCGVLITMLSFAPWVRFHSISDELTTPGAPEASIKVAGTELSRWRNKDSLGRNDVQNVDGWCSCDVSVGDGYLTAFLGIILIAAAAGAFAGGRDRPSGMVGVVASLGVLGVAGYDGIGKWNAYVWTNLQALEVAQGTVQLGLILLIVAAAVAAVLSGLLWGAGAEEVHEEMLEEEEWDDTAEYDGGDHPQSDVMYSAWPADRRPHSEGRMTWA
jgi:hypothetical protein